MSVKVAIAAVTDKLSLHDIMSWIFTAQSCKIQSVGRAVLPQQARSDVPSPPLPPWPPLTAREGGKGGLAVRSGKPFRQQSAVSTTVH